MIGSLHSRFWALVLAAGLAVPLASAQALDGGWPRTLPVDAGMVTIYEPQVDGMDGDVIRYRAALAWRPSADAEPIFGAGWFESKVDIDRSQRIVRPQNLELTNTRFPAGTADLQPGLSAALAEQAPRWNLDYSLDRLDAALEAAAAEQQAVQQLNTAPPRIIYRDRPALLVQLDGDPVLRTIEDSPYQAVINTPYPLISDGKRYYLNAARGVWYQADRALGPYRFEASPPAGIVAMVKPDEAVPAESAAGTAGQAPAEPVTAANAPEIVVATEPAELIVTEGPAAFVPLVDDLLVLQNSEDDVFMHLGSQQYYIVLAGRWYRAKSLNGPWAWQAADQLPPAFADIPQTSDQADSRVYVAGTPEAEEAVLDAQLPQTAAVERGPVDIEVEYDGEPDFEPVDGTDELRYAANSGATVLQSDRQYYLVEDGVWYVSDMPNGPWEVSAYRPAAVNTIAPTSPVYNVRYVYIYDRTPSVVYVGYTPGYLGSYVYYNTVVYGTGWHYRPWVSPYYYYPRPSTWGYHVGYNPWSGWSYGLSWNWGWYGGSYGGWSPYYASYYSGGYWHHDHYWHHRHYSYWGPRGYRPRPPRHYRDHYYHGGGDRYAYDRHDNLYRDARQRAPVARTRDNPPHQWARDGKSSARDRYYAGPDKWDRQRTQPVKPSDLHMKARLRDANREASRKLLVADSSGNVRPQASTRPAKTVSPAYTAKQRQSRFKAPQSAKASRPSARAAAPAQQQKAVPPQKAVRAQTMDRPQKAVPQQKAVPSQKAAPQRRAVQPQRAAPQPKAAPQRKAVEQQREAPQRKAVQQQRSFQQPKAAPQQRAAPAREPRASSAERAPRGNEREAGGSRKERSRDRRD